MLKNYFKIAYRNLLKNKVFSLVNILGLAVGMAACFFVFQYVHFESSYDSFHKNSANIYRVPISFSGSFANIPTYATNHPAVGPMMKADFPEVIDFARVVHPSLFFNAITMSYTDWKGNNAVFNEDKIYITDPSFLSIFSFPFITGDPKKVLSEPNSVVISKTISQKYFGAQNPIGQIIHLNGKMALKITGVFKDVPENSHIKFDMLVSFLTLGEKWGYHQWGFPEFYNYVLLAPGTDPKRIEAKFPAFINKYLGAIMKELNFGNEFHLQPLTDIHLKSNFLKEPESNGSEKEIYFLSIIGIFILLIAWINYINLSTARSMERAKEVGLRKVIGGTRAQLIGQFIMESFIVNLLALCVASIIVTVCLPYFGQFIGKNITGGSLSSELWHEPKFWLILSILFIAGACLVGAYPAFVISAFKPALVLKGKFSQSNKGVILRKTLVAFQLFLSILLIAGTITVYKQLSFMRNQELGYNKDQVVVVKAPAVYDSTIAPRIHTLKEQLSKYPAITGMTSSSDIPGKTLLGRNTVRKASDDKTHNFISFQMEIDENFINTFKIELAAGRNFQQQDSINVYNTTQKMKVIINEVVANALGYKNAQAAIHQNIVVATGAGEVNSEIIGVIKNYHQRSLKEAYDPILYYYPSYNNWTYFSLNINTKNLHQDLASLENLYKKTFPGNPFEYFFLDEYFNHQYQSDQRFGSIFGLFTGLAIFVACLGLLGLSGFMIRLRTKEIGIRRILGASVYNILVLFSRDIVKLACIASFIAIPVIYLIANRWLNNYAFHIHVSWPIFITPPLLLLLISLVLVGVQSFKSALSNPVKNLRAE